MLGYKKALARKQAELESQVSGLRNSVALLSQEYRSTVEGLSKEVRTEIANLHKHFKAMDESLKAQMTAVTRVTEAIGRSSDLEAINLMETFQTFADRLNHVEEAVNHFAITAFEAPAANGPMEPVPAAVATTAPENPAPKRRRGRPRKSESYSGGHSGAHSAAEA
jgi:hypothetical protein